MKPMKKLEITKWDKIIIVFLLLLSVLPVGGIVLTKVDSQNKDTIIIKVDNKLEKSISLQNQEESEIYKFNFNKNIGYIEVKDGKVRMLEMDREVCPDAICSYTGWIDKSYQSIVCLPNKIIVTIEGSKDEEIDA